MAFLDNNGLGTLWGRIKTKFAVGFSPTVSANQTSVTIKLKNGYGNDLDNDTATTPSYINSVTLDLADSTNSKAGLMSPTEKSKLAGIASGAEVNVQANWNQTTTTADDYIKNKPTIPSPGTGTSYPAMDGTRALGTQAGYARVDHVHPSDTSRVPTTRTVNGHALSADVNINSSDIYVAPNITLGSWISTVQPNINYVDTGKKVTTYVSEQISSAMTGAAKYKGTVGTGGKVTTLPTSGYKQGDYYVVCAAGTYAGESCEVGDMIFANKDYASGAVAADDWDIVQANITAMTDAEINAICV